jgi:hypothetical protein
MQTSAKLAYGLPRGQRLKVSQPAHYQIVRPRENRDRHELLTTDVKDSFDNRDFQ